MIETTPAKPRLKAHLSVFGIALLLAASSFGARFWFIRRADLAESYAKGPYRTLVRAISAVTGLFPFSLSEALVVLAVVVMLPLAVCYVVRLMRRPWRSRRLLRAALLAAAAGFTLISGFQALHGLNYERYPLAVSLELDVRPRDKDTLDRAARWLMQEASLARSLLPENSAGVVETTLSKREILEHTAGAYARLGEQYEQFAALPERLPKPVLLSRLWSYTGITGMYNPVLAEANINMDQPAFAIPFAALHEAAHVAGYAREDEANYLAFLSGIYHPLPEYRYAALHVTLTYVANRLYRLDPDGYFAAIRSLDAAVARDLNAQSAYWKSFQGPVRQVSTAVNNTFLKTQRQADGVQSYGRMIDLVLAFHDKYGDIPVGLAPMSALGRNP